METTKYRYIDLKGKEGREGFKEMHHLKKGDEVEVNLFELGYPEISDFIFSLKRTADRMDTTIELSFNQGTTFDGFQIFRFNQQSTTQKETIQRLTKWHKTEDDKPKEGEQYLVYDEINRICFDSWVKLYEEPVPGMGRICIGEGWEETEIEGSYWMEIPNYPEEDPVEQLLSTTEPIDTKQDFYCGERVAGKDQCDNQCPSCADDI